MVEISLEPDGESALPSAPESSSTPELPVSSLHKVFLGGNLGPTDDTATIISKAHPSPNRGDEAMAEILRGRKLAHFELLEAIGVGGMAAVIRARDSQLDRTVALKVLPPDMAGDPENVLRFQQEARAAAKLDHENIARVFYCGEDQGLHFIAFELVEGENLRTLLEKRGRLPVPEALSYVLQISTGLAHAAARSVVHRDIKPSNIIISSSGRAKLVDMGLARSLETHQDDGLTQSGVTLGTFDYISPEQALEPRQADARSDIYSLGCTFYQMVTGQAPVPDGTAAKKLHHHQHVDPVDPRQLNPEISTNVALVLAKMIAKDPNDRYQHPEELVEHLIALARLEGGREEKPDGVLFVDARLPGPYIGRPVLTTCVAVAALCVLVVVLGQSSTDTYSKPLPQFKSPLSNDTAAIPAPRDIAEGGNKSNDEAVGPTIPVVPEVRLYHANSSGSDLAHEVKSAVSARVYIPATGMKLSRDEQLEFDGKDLWIEPETPGSEKKPVLRLTYDTMPPGIPPWAILTIRGGNVRIRGIRFELDSAGADMAMSAVSRQGGTVAFDDCEFVQVRAGDHGRIASFQAGGPPPTVGTTAVVFNHCYFEGGQQAIVLSSPLAAKLTQCAFGTHTGPLVDVGNSGVRSTAAFDVRLVHCSALSASEAIFVCRDAVNGDFSIENSLFARADDKGASARSTALLRQEGAASEHLSYSGQGNVYYNLSPYYQRIQDAAPVETAARIDAFHRRVNVVDDQSQELKGSPWQEPDPVRALDSGIVRAFRVNPTNPLLRQAKEPKRPVGVEVCSWGEVYSPPLPPIEASHIADPPFRHDEKIVDPDSIGTTEGVYRTLRQAVEDARPYDVILIKHKGPLAVDSVRLERSGMEITIKPHPGFKPVLKLGNTTDSDAALFRLYDSHLTLEGLEVHLAPASMQFKAQTVAAIMGDGQLTMKDCVVTLEAIRETPLYMVTLADPSGSGVIRMDPQPIGQQQPRVHLDNCFVRGAGDLVYVRASRPFELRVENSLIVLDGSFLMIDGAGKDPAMRTRSEITLKQVTAYLTNHLIWLRASREDGRVTKGLTPTYVQSASDCVFASATGKSLVHLDGFDADEQMKRCFLWGESKRNLYSNYDQLLDQVPGAQAGDMMPPTPYGRMEWGEFTKDPDVKFDRLRFQGAPLQDAVLAKTPAADFRMKAEANLPGYGAELDRLPLPSESGSRQEAR